MAESLVVKKNVVFNNNERVEEYELTVTTQTGGAFTTAAIGSDEITGWIAMGETDPGSPAPDANYDVTILDSRGVDVFGGELTNRSASATEQTMPKIGNAYGERWVNSDLELALAGNTAGSAVTEVRLIVRKGTR